MKSLKVYQIVRHWGRVGGMEIYVWELSHQLALCGYDVTVICEKSFELGAKNIRIVELGSILKRPRYLSYLFFAIRVSVYLNARHIKVRNSIIHSHERSFVHNISTIHSSPYKPNFPYIHFLSFKTIIYSFLEKKEVLGCLDKHPIIVPVSDNLRQKLLFHYPEAGNYIFKSIAPGVSKPRTAKKNKSKDNIFTVGFIGKEWKRKGLFFFSEIVIALSNKIPNIRVIILGPEKKDIEWIFKNSNLNIFFAGWQKSEDFYSKMDLLIHPACDEAYGMVIAEAMAHNIPVIVSDKCGASMNVKEKNGSILKLSDPVDFWVNACIFWLKKKKKIIGYERPWTEVVKEYNLIYKNIN